MNGVETKVAAGSATAVVTGLLTWALVTFVPAFRTGLPPQLATFLPVAVAWALSTVAAYVAPHTPRPPAVPASASRHGYAPGGPVEPAQPPPGRSSASGGGM